jgi:ribosomal protein S18 acetylase RimI-like enzyme
VISPSRSRDIRLRPVTEGDSDFLLRLYASTRADELALVPWTDEQKRAFVEMQFRAQSSAYAEYENTTFDIIVVEGADAGRLYVARKANEISIVDISLLPEFRRQEIGTGLLRQLIAEASAAQRPLRIHVEQFSPALRLYERLGFRPIAERGLYLQLEHRGA